MIEQFREASIISLYELKSVQPCWPIWLKVMHEGVSNHRDPDQILMIADRLKQVFRETKGAPSKGASDEQSKASAGGTAWEALVCYYLNLCLIGTTSVVVRKRSMVNGPITQAITARYENEAVNSESDLLAITFPDRAPFRDPPGKNLGTTLKAINKALGTGAIKETALAVIQCKTNWNDNSQVPMLWDLIYRPDSKIGGKVVVGIGGYGPGSFQSLRYAFVTVPTSRGKLTRKSVAVRRVNALTGGNYWGMKSENGIAMSLSEIFRKATIGPDGGAGVRESLLKSLEDLKTKYSYFKF